VKKKSPFSDLLKSEKLSKESYLFQLEHLKVSTNLFFLKLEVHNYKQELVFKFKIQIEPDNNLKKLKSGQSISKVGLISWSNKNAFQLIKDGLENAVGEGRIPFLPSLS
jgi:hypothetical protein